MLHDLIEAEARPGHCLFVRFDDGMTGTLDIGAMVRFDGVFAPLRDEAYFALARIDPDLGTVIWPSGADLCPDVLHAAVTGQPLPGIAESAHAP